MLSEKLLQFVQTTGFTNLDSKSLIMLGVGALLVYLAVVKEYEPTLLLPMGFGCILVNIPLAGLMEPGVGLLYWLNQGVVHDIYPPLIFIGIGAMMDFGPLLANPGLFILGAAGQVGIFTTFLGALALGFPINQAGAIGIIGAADGPTSVFAANILAPELLGPITVAAFSYMSLIPIIQPPVMKALTTKEERGIVMTQLRPVSRFEKLAFPIAVTIVIGLAVPASMVLIGPLMLGNLFRESGVVERLSKTAQNELTNIATIFLGISVGGAMTGEAFVKFETLMILGLGFIAFIMGSASGVIFAKIMNLFVKNKINPLIGSAGISAMPMAARVSHKMGLEENPHNFLIMHAMAANVAGQIASPIAAAVVIAMLAK